MEDDKVKVAVRIRPLNKKEIDIDAKCIANVTEGQVTIVHPNNEKQPKTFAFDNCFDSMIPGNCNFADQCEVYDHLGLGVLDNAFDGYNACIFAYGQTGSGKSYSMMGNSENPGIIPRLCNSMFDRIAERTCSTTSFKVEVSFMEIYNERVRDLLDPKKSAKNLKVREHKVLGPMVDGLSVLAVSSYQQIESLIEEGNKSRTVAATNMNAESSRSHAVFNIRLTQVLKDFENGFTGEKMSKISLVDLAGSERAQKSGAVGKRLEEGGSINKSLTTLGMVISALAERSLSKQKFIPYRDSVLTWLLKDNLGGNSKTIMIATISPSTDNYEESLSTLRYADRAKKIVNHATVNEDPNAKIIRELREEVEALRSQISETHKEHIENEELRDRLAESERLIDLMNKSWEERLRETDLLYKERQKDLAEIGVSVAGIKMRNDRFYLVNLNADPSLNELLVYYINEKAVIGSPDQGNDSEDTDKVDIILQGLGIYHRHAILEVVEEENQRRIYVKSIDSRARICVNGRPISQRTLLRNRYRLLLGNNHFFRVNCPKESMDVNSSTYDDASTDFDYDDAWNEVNSDANNDPITVAVDEYMEEIAKKHEEEKQDALERQYEAFEKYIQGLTQSYTPSTPLTPSTGFITSIYTPFGKPIAFPANPKATVRSKFFTWAQQREKLFKDNLTHLKNDIMRANALVREANMIAVELSSGKRPISYDVTLQIPAANLRPSKIKKGKFVCEPVIIVKRAGIDGHQIWTLTQLEDKLVDMRERYDEEINRVKGIEESEDLSEIGFSPHEFSGYENNMTVLENVSENHENHNLIGVANVFLEVLFHDIKLDYHVPIINQQGEVSGRLHVEVYRIQDSEGNNSYDSKNGFYDRSLDYSNIGMAYLGQNITCKVRIKRASGLPSTLSHFVFCQYSFFNINEILVVAPVFDSSTACDNGHNLFSPRFEFDHEMDFTISVTEEFLEYVQDDALSIEVWGHRSSGFGNDFICDSKSDRIDVEESFKSLQERWADVVRRVELHVDIKELNEAGHYISVDVQRSPDVLTGGIYQLKQGYQRRIVVTVKSSEKGNLPISFAEINSVSIGCLCSRNPALQKPLDSYQEEDLDRIKDQWTKALRNRQEYLEKQINSLPIKSACKTNSELEREQSLINQWILLTEERNAVSVPVCNSDIPGAPSDWEPPAGFERHIPVIFLDLNADDMTSQSLLDELPKVAGAGSILPKEHCGQNVLLPILQRDTFNCSAICSWDSSIHEYAALNRTSNGTEHVYAILKVTIGILCPCKMEVVLRKRLCFNIYKKNSITNRLFKKIVSTEKTIGTGVFYDFVAHVPRSFLDVEDRSTLAKLAARPLSSTDDESLPSEDGKSDQYSYIEAYTKSIQVVESMLKLDRLRQEVAINNLLNKQDRLDRQLQLNYTINQGSIKRTASLPNAQCKSIIATNSSSNDGKNKPFEKPYAPTSSLVASLVSPMIESTRLSEISEENVYNNIHIETMSKSSTVPETMHTSAYQTLADFGARKRLGKLNGREHDNSITDNSFGENFDAIYTKNIGRSKKHGHYMTFSSTSDSGCMMESVSSTTTEDDRQDCGIKEFS